MLIELRKIYSIKIQEENAVRENHDVISNSKLLFSGKDLLEAIILTGMLPPHLKEDVGAYSNVRKNEVLFKIHLVEMALKEVGGVISIDEVNFNELESSEKRAVDYYLGMFFATLMIRKHFKYEYAIHYSKFRKSSLCKSIQPKHILDRIEPDIIAIDRLNKNRGVFEAKGHLGTKIDASVVEHAYDQVHQVASINHIRVKDRYVLYSILNEDANVIDYKDPDGNENIDLDIYMALLSQYIPIVQLIEELGYQDNGYRIRASKLKINSETEITFQIAKKDFDIPRMYLSKTTSQSLVAPVAVMQPLC